MKGKSAMPRKPRAGDTEQMIVGYLLNKAKHYEDLAASFADEGATKEVIEGYLKRGQTFTMHEIEDQARIWWRERGETLSAGTFLRAAFRVNKSGILGKLTKTPVPKKRYLLYKHELGAAQLEEQLTMKEFKIAWAHPRSSVE